MPPLPHLQRTYDDDVNIYTVLRKVPEGSDAKVPAPYTPYDARE